MKTCPYCKQYIEDHWSYCHHCNKPLIVNIDSKTNGRINEILDDQQTLGKTKGSLLLEEANIYYKKRDLATAIRFLDMALNYFKADNDILNLAITHNEIGLINEEKGFYDNAIYHFQQSIEEFHTINEYPKLILIYNNLANIYFLVKDLEHAYEFYNKALNLAREVNLLSEEIKTSSNLVEILFLLKNYDKIERILNRNLDYFKQISDTYGVIITLTKIGKLNYHLGANNSEFALQKLIEALELINGLESQGELIPDKKAKLEWECFFYLGKLSLLLNNNNEAEEHILKSLKAIRIFEPKETLDEAKVLKNLAKVYEKGGDNERAIEYNTMASEIYYKFGDDIKVAQLKNKIALIYSDKIMNESEAIIYYEEALEIFEDLRYMKETANILHKMGDIYINKGITELALSNWTKAKDFYQEILDDYNLNLVTEKIKTLDNSS